jgi:hypothetical protein
LVVHVWWWLVCSRCKMGDYGLVEIDDVVTRGVGWVNFGGAPIYALFN